MNLGSKKKELSFIFKKYEISPIGFSIGAGGGGGVHSGN
jgi:hypothetical protein